ncbi:MAG: hypothetical protein HZA31_02585 [Opitutae bacterium]|nr:hypothetical protein [Opitutae bacterium]
MNTIDWLVVALSCVLVFAVGIWFARKSSQQGAEGYFAGDRDVPWWAIGLSNTATYQSGNGAFVMLLIVFGLAGNWLWWTTWIVWMPLTAVIWARLWQRLRIVTIAELITLRYGGAPALWARKVYAFVCCFGFAVLVIAYITGFFAKTIAPLCPLTTWQILLIFGGTTVLYTMFGGLLGVVYSDVVQFAILFLGSVAFLWLAIPQFGGWGHIMERLQHVRPEALQQMPPTNSIDALTLLVLFIQGWFVVGDGTTTQRFMAAKNERHAIGGQLFNTFLALSFRTLPLIGLGLIALSIFWTSDPQAKLGAAPGGMTLLSDPSFAWAELIKKCTLPMGFVGLLVAAEVAAYMSTLSSLINWGGSLVVNDLMPARMTGARDKIWVSRITTLCLFLFAAVITVLFVDNMVSWFMFINSAMGIFLLPLAVFRFLWWRFNVWGELAATICGLPLSIWVWFGLDYQSKPMWQGLGLLLGSSLVVLVVVTLLTPPESMETLKKFYLRCRPPGFWGPVRKEVPADPEGDRSRRRLWLDAVLGLVSCAGMVVATNAVFVGDWWRFGLSMVACVGGGAWLIQRILQAETKPQSFAEEKA